MPYHINRRGVAAPCRATKGNCPLGSSFDTKQNASVAAEKQTKEFLSNSKKEANEEQVKGLVDKGAYGTIEREISNYDSNSLSIANENLVSVRKEYKDIDNSTRNDLAKKSQEIHKEREERINELKGNSNTSKEQIEKLNKAKSDLQHAYEQRNKLTPSNYQKLVLDKRSEVFVAEKAVQNSIENAVKDDPKIKELDKKLEENTKKSNAVEYILKSTSKPHKKSTGGLTKIEKAYQERVAADEKIMKKVGVTKVIKQSKDMAFGNNPLPDELVVDKKGRISNLYIEHSENKGELLKVVKIHDSDTGNLELSNGKKITMQQSNNTRSNPYAKASDTWKFYTTPPKGKEKYKGYNQVKLNVIDTGY